MGKDTILQLVNIKKSFGDTLVLDNVGLQMEKGEFITLLGSSGCGKTTTLRIIAGLETPDSGTVLLEGEDVTDRAPNKRDVNTVFQNYALFPHMTVEANIAYSLKIRKKTKAEIKKSVKEALELVQLQGFEKRMPSELSGGQKQRVAIARAIVNEPKVLLLDEPLGALDLQLRRQMQIELKRLQKKLGITFVYITHDQEEALNMSDRIAVMHNGVFEQIGTPAEVYDSPKTAYVARFVGTANIISGTVKSVGEDVVVGTEGGTCSVLSREKFVRQGDRVTIAVHSEHVKLDTENNAGLSGTVKEKSFAGGMLRISVTLADGNEIVASRYGIDSTLAPGDQVFATWPSECAVIVEDR